MNVFPIGRGLLISLAMLGLSACVSSGLIPESQIQKSADSEWQSILEAKPPSTNLTQTRLVSITSDRILRAAGEDPSEWQTVLFDDPETVNAFALPNNKIGIFFGLVGHVENEDQLAAIIGHEVAHVRLRHAEERLSRGFAPGVLIGVAKLPGAVTGVGALESVGEVAGGAVAAGTIYPFNRNDELEADLEGLKYLADAGYDPNEAAEFWRNLNNSDAGKKRKVPEFLSTHPSDERRVAALEKAARELTQ
ncbi:MAG: M48 family metallopeptidase [Pseudomonadota bacterium]